MAGEADLADDAHALGLGDDTGELDALADRIQLDAVETLIEIELPPGAAEFTVGGELQPDLLLLADGLVDLAVLDFGQLRVGDPALGVLGARFLERRGAQQTADMVGAKRRRVALHCCRLPDDSALRLSPVSCPGSGAA